MQEKKRVLFQLSTLGYGGTEKAIYTFLENIDRNLFEPYVFFYTDYKQFSYYRRLIKSFFSKKAKKTFTEKYITYMARLEDFKSILDKENFYYGTSKDFFHITKNIQPDIIHFNRGVEETFFTQNIHTISNKIQIVESSIFGKASNITYLNRVNKIFFISQWLLKQSTWSPVEKTSLLYLTVKHPSTDMSLRTQYHIPKTAIVLGRMSRPNLDDGEFIANVLNKVLMENIYFLVIGASNSLREKLATHKHVIFIDPTTDTNFISSFYNTIDVLLHYRKEGETFGMNIAEAMIHGKPVISHESFLDNAQIELLLGQEDLPCGIVVKENDLNGYIAATKQLINNTDKRLTMGHNAQIKAKSNYAEDVVTRQLETYYLELLNTSQSLNDA